MIASENISFSWTARRDTAAGTRDTSAPQVFITFLNTIRESLNKTIQRVKLGLILLITISDTYGESYNLVSSTADYP